MYKNILPVDEGDMVYNRTKKKTPPHPTIFFFYHTECFQGRCFFPGSTKFGLSLQKFQGSTPV